MKKLNLKKMIKEMSFIDKAKLIIGDYKKQDASKGKERLLTSEEVDAIVKDCQDKDQIPSLNRLITLYNLCLFNVMDIQNATLLLESKTYLIQMVTIGAYYNESKKELLDEVLFMVEGKTDKTSKAVRNFLEDELSQKDKFKDIGFFNYLTLEEKMSDRQPNLLIQALYMRAYEAYVHLSETIYMNSYIQEQAKIDLLGELQIKILEEGIKQKAEFEGFKGFLKVIDIYKNLSEEGLIKQSDYEEPEFLELINNKEEMLILTEEQKSAAREKVHKGMNKSF